MEPDPQNSLNLPSEKNLEIFRRDLLYWFEKNGRKFPWRKSSSKYRCIIAEILLQRTRAETVSKFLPDFFQQYPSWKKLSQATIEELQGSLKPIGLWRRRASSMKELSLEMVRRNGRFPRLRTDIESLPGVGQYITNAVLLFCHGEPQPLLDTNMARVLERVFGPRKMADIRYDPYLQQLALKVVDCDSPKKVNWAILDLAALICFPKKPSCNQCPVSLACNYYSENKN
jgi:A/G-specific adenine glycosylase